MNIFFRVDASHSIGTGHMMRCMALADALRQKNHQITFVCCESEGNYIFTLKNKKYPVISLPNNLANSMAFLKTKKIDWLIVDHYGLDEQWENACRPYVKNILAVDDINRSHHCDILLDQNYYLDATNCYHNKIPNHCKMLIGPQYALLRPEFNEIRKKIISRNGKVNRLMVSLGGTNPHQGTQKVLAAIQNSNYQELIVDVVLGALCQNKDEIEEWCKTKKNYHFHCSAKNIAEIMQQADLAIGAGGTTTWERCCLGLPSLVIKIASNQDELIKQGLSIPIFDYLGDITKINEKNIADKLNEIACDSKKLQMMSQNGMRLVDGLGVNRVIDAMLAF